LSQRFNSIDNAGIDGLNTFSNMRLHMLCEFYTMLVTS